MPKNKPAKAKIKKKEVKKKRRKPSSRQKYKRGGRIEAYTMGEALSSKKWP